MKFNTRLRLGAPLSACMAALLAACTVGYLVAGVRELQQRAQIDTDARILKYREAVDRHLQVRAKAKFAAGRNGNAGGVFNLHGVSGAVRQVDRRCG